MTGLTSRVWQLLFLVSVNSIYRLIVFLHIIWLQRIVVVSIGTLYAQQGQTIFPFVSSHRQGGLVNSFFYYALIFCADEIYIFFFLIYWRLSMLKILVVIISQRNWKSEFTFWLDMRTPNSRCYT